MKNKKMNNITMNIINDIKSTLMKTNDDNIFAKRLFNEYLWRM